MSKDYTVTVSAQALSELVLAAHSYIDYENKPVSSREIADAQEEARALLYGCGYWKKDGV